MHVLPRLSWSRSSRERRASSALDQSLLHDHAPDDIMPARNSNDDSLAARLSRSHISTTSSAEDLTDTEAAHNAALAAAQAQHQRVRDSALRAFSNDILRQEQALLRREQAQELERLKLESEKARLEAGLQELQRKKVTTPIPRAPSPPPPQVPTPKQANPSHSQYSNGQSYSGSPPGVRNGPPTRQKTPPPPANPQESVPQPVQSVETRTPSIASKQESVQPPSSTHIKELVHSAAPRKQLTPNLSSPNSLPGAEKYVEIHKRLKKLRAYVTDHAKKDLAFKKKMGEMRREIRKSVGQLTEGRGANRTPMRKLVDTLKEALTTPSPPVDPSMVMLSTPAPMEGSPNNGNTLPILFLYLLNMFSKAVLSQFIDEAGVSPKAADPIGVVAVSIFAQSDLSWRGVSLIDILICKFRVVCPVLFGIRGNEKTEEGRARLGWWREQGGGWVSEQTHNTRMTGLGAGYAAISLRDFSKSSSVNPYPPTKYWQSIASIVNTPLEETSSTQFIVLKAMIENYEQRFMVFYGSAARAALQVALVEFPGRANENSVAVSSLKVLRDKLRRDVGLKLESLSEKT